jgi:hypothetical protein
MNITIISSIVETSGLGIFIFFLIKGLTRKIKLLEDQTKIQTDTLKIMERRIEETEKIGNIYKKLIEDIPEDIEHYKTFISRTRDDVIIELKEQNREIKEQLDSAEKKIKGSLKPEERIIKYLHALSKMVSTKDEDKNEKEFILKDICEFEDRKIDESIMHLVDSNTLEEFLEKIAFNLEIDDEKEVFDLVFKDKEERKLPNGERIRNAKGIMRVDGWCVIVNSSIYASTKLLSELKDEFSTLKT